jgi:copper homeostasis protein
MIFELAVFHPDSVAIAQACKVSRIELCDNYAVGGVTPSIDNFIAARKIFEGPIMVMIRPRAGDFICDDDLINQMVEEINAFDNLGADGFVFGCLNANKSVNASQLDLLVNASNKKSTTFHRAIDEVVDYEAGLQTLINCGVSNVLTTACSASALQGKLMIESMINRFETQLNFIAGGGVRSSNISELLTNSNITQIHSAAITQKENFIADEYEVRKIIEIVNYA